MTQPDSRVNVADWRAAVVKYERPHLGRSLWQIANSVIPYLVLWYLMYRSLEISYWLTLALAVVAAGFLTRIFIICHDCGHNAFFKSKTANNLWGWFTALFTLMPFYQWRHDHAVHHATSGDLDRRGVGEIWTMTVREYQQASRWRRLAYRLYRNPFVMFGVGALYYFLIRNRFTTAGSTRAARRNVHWTNLVLTILLLAVGLTIGLTKFAQVQGPILVMGMAAGVWLFYVQHQFDGAYWAPHEEWSYVSAALEGSSYYKLPKVLQWFTGNIGFHHIHHLSPRIPNYYLERCHNENPLFCQIPPVTLRSSLKAVRYRLWDEEQQRLVGFKALREPARTADQRNQRPV